MEEAYKNKDNSYTFVRWDNIEELIKELKELRKNIE